MRRFIVRSSCSAAVATARAADDKSPGVVVDKDKHTVTIDAKVAPRKIDHPSYKGEIYPIEVVACWPFLGEPGKGGEKAHETIVTIDTKIKPSAVHKALEELGLKPGTPVAVEGKEPKGPKINVYIEMPGADGEPKRLTMDKVLLDPKTKKPFPKSVEFRFTGSAHDPARPREAGEDLWRRPERHPHRHLPGDREDRLPDEPDAQGREVS